MYGVMAICLLDKLRTADTPKLTNFDLPRLDPAETSQLIYSFEFLVGVFQLLHGLQVGEMLRNRFGVGSCCCCRCVAFWCLLKLTSGEIDRLLYNLSTVSLMYLKCFNILHGLSLYERASWEKTSSVTDISFLESFD